MAISDVYNFRQVPGRVHTINMVVLFVFVSCIVQEVPNFAEVFGRDTFTILLPAIARLPELTTQLRTSTWPYITREEVVKVILALENCILATVTVLPPVFDPCQAEVSVV